MLIKTVLSGFSWSRGQRTQFELKMTSMIGSDLNFYVNNRICQVCLQMIFNYQIQMIIRKLIWSIIKVLVWNKSSPFDKVKQMKNLVEYFRIENLLGHDSISKLSSGLMALRWWIIVGISTNTTLTTVHTELSLNTTTEQLIVIVVDWVHEPEPPHWVSSRRIHQPPVSSNTGDHCHQHQPSQHC